MLARYQPRFHISSTNALIAFMRGVVGICFLFSLTVDAAPRAVRQTLVVTAQVLEVDCTTRAVKKKACAPVVVTTETPKTENARLVLTTVLFY